MTPDEETVRTVYESIKRGDAATASGCYADDAAYRDLAFDLRGASDIAAMWRLVCSRHVKVKYCNIRTEGSEVKGEWEFDYLFRGTRPVHNPMRSTFVFRDGKIISHHDDASLWNWAKQALGVAQATLVTAFPLILRRQAKEELRVFKEAESRSVPVSASR
jgi:ketosteroid isomerase-like protein